MGLDSAARILAVMLISISHPQKILVWVIVTKWVEEDRVLSENWSSSKHTLGSPSEVIVAAAKDTIKTTGVKMVDVMSGIPKDRVPNLSFSSTTRWSGRQNVFVIPALALFFGTRQTDVTESTLRVPVRKMPGLFQPVIWLRFIVNAETDSSSLRRIISVSRPIAGSL